MKSTTWTHIQLGTAEPDRTARTETSVGRSALLGRCALDLPLLRTRCDRAAPDDSAPPELGENAPASRATER